MNCKNEHCYRIQELRHLFSKKSILNFAIQKTPQNIQEVT